MNLGSLEHLKTGVNGEAGEARFVRHDRNPLDLLSFFFDSFGFNFQFSRKIKE